MAVTTYEPTGATLAALETTTPSPAASGTCVSGPASATASTVLTAAGEAIMTWQLHRKAGVRPRPSAPRADPGVTVVSSVPITAPCVVVWVLERPDRIGFGYGTTEGHPFSGEESFTTWIDAAGDVWFAVIAFSRPARWYTTAAGPVAPVFQRLYARRLGRILRKLALA